LARYLIDSHIFLWAAENPSTLSAAELAVLSDPHVELVVSVASIWELSIKAAIGRLEIPGRPHAIPPNHFARSAEKMGIPVLPIEAPEAEYVRQLPHIHGDPFDRMLIAQALQSARTIVTRDAVFARYPGVQVFSP
jgi:PIN domain nuclease of toxin-antitoxin system